MDFIEYEPVADSLGLVEYYGADHEDDELEKLIARAEFGEYSKDQVHEAVRRLPKWEKVVIVMIYGLHPKLGAYTFLDVADIFNLNLVTVNKYHASGLERLKAVLKPAEAKRQCEEEFARAIGLKESP